MKKPAGWRAGRPLRAFRVARALTGLLLVMDDAVPPVVEGMGVFRIEQGFVEKAGANNESVEQDDCPEEEHIGCHGGSFAVAMIHCRPAGFDEWRRKHQWRTRRAPCGRGPQARKQAVSISSRRCVVHTKGVGVAGQGMHEPHHFVGVAGLGAVAHRGIGNRGFRPGAGRDHDT